MPQVVVFLATAAAEALGDALLAAGVSAATASVIATATLYLTEAALVIGASVAASAIMAPSIPTPEAGRQSVKQQIPSRIRGYGRARLGGAYMLDEARDDVLFRVFAFHDGRIDGIEQWYLHDDKVSLTGDTVNGMADGAFADGRVKIEYRLGLPTETVYSSLNTEAPEFWGVNARGDGIASYYIRCKNGDLKDFPKQFPNSKPQPTVAARLSCVYDWRDPDQSLADPATWVWTRNCVVCLVHELLTVRGYDWDRHFAPVEALLTAEADICDEEVPAHGGGSLPRYLVDGFYTDDNAMGDVVKCFIEAMDGFMCRRGDGAVIIRAGHYYEPTVVFTSQDVTDYTWQSFVVDEAAVNELRCSFVSPEHDYGTVETDAWRDEADIAARGAVRSQPFSPKWVQQNGQTRRLAKRKMIKATAASGSITTTLVGLKALGERYIRVQLGDDEIEELSDTVLEITGDIEIGDDGMSVTFPVIAISSAIDDWDPATEEGFGPPAPERPGNPGVGAPVIQSVTAQGSAPAYILILTLAPPGRDSLSVDVAWRAQGASTWATSAPQTPVVHLDGTLEVRTNVVTAPIVEIEVRYFVAGGGSSNFSAIETVDLTDVPAGAPTDLDAVGGSGTADITFRNPTTAFAYVVVFRATVNDFSFASDVSGHIVGGLGQVMTFTDTASAGPYYWWAQAFNAADVGSTPTGPASAAIS